MKFARCLAALLACLASVLAALPAHAGTITVTITEKNGRPVEDAVVTIYAPGTAPAPRKFEITQKDMKFVPHVLAIPLGSTVEFGNLDPMRHHVYSFSPARKFELKLFGQGQTRPVRFDKPGPIAIGCNIHDSMQAFIMVVDTRHAAKSGKSGRVVLRGVPPGKHELRVWHPQLRAPGNQLVLSVDASANRSIPVTVRLRRPAPQMHDY